MVLLKRLVILSIVLCMAAVMPSVAGHAQTGTIVDEGFIPAGAQGVVGRQGVQLMERPDYEETASVLRGRPAGSMGGTKSCTSLSDSNCSTAERISFGAILQPCLSATSLNCVAGFGLIGNGDAKIAATFERKFPSEAVNKYSPDASAGLPEGGPGALWTFPASAGLPVSLHFLRASVVGSIKDNKAVFEGFAASLTPVSLTTMRCDQNTENLRVGKNECTSGDFQTTRDEPGFSGFVEGSGWGQGLDCEMAGNADYIKETAECALRKPALLETKYYLDVRLAQSPQGWMHGRLTDADVAITPIAGVTGAVSLSIIGKSVRVPVVFKEVSFGSLPSSLQEKYRGNGTWPGGFGFSSNWGLMDTNSNDPNGRNRLSKPPPYGASGIEELEAWMDFLNDTSTADRVTWSLRTLRTWERDRANSCIADTSRVTGLVLTNATQYLAGAPDFNKETQSLDYKVGAPHRMSNGEVFKGSYQMIVRSDVAKCIYGFSSTAVKATVEIVESESGQASTVVTSISEKDGWLRLAASGYTHSAPTIRAIFTEDKAPAVTTAPNTVNTVTNTPAVKTSRMKVKASLATKTVASRAGLKVVKGSRVAVSVARASRKVCAIRGSQLRATKKGTCTVSVSVIKGKKKTTRTLRITVR
jgi:hypothetical protein